jgi:hypothetical protein
LKQRNCSGIAGETAAELQGNGSGIRMPQNSSALLPGFCAHQISKVGGNDAEGLDPLRSSRPARARSASYRDHEAIGDPRSIGLEILGDAVGEILLLSIVAEIDATVPQQIGVGSAQ